MSAAVVRSVAVIGLGLIILAALLYVASTVDGRAPEVTEIRLAQPVADDASRALITTSLEVVFTEPVEQASAEAALSIQPPVAGSVSWSGSSMIFTPAEPLQPAARYRVTIGPGIRDIAGNRMTRDFEPFTFETAGPPEVALTEPEDGAAGVGLAGPITITFASLMDTASVEAALRLRPSFGHDLRWNGSLLEVVPSAPLEPDREYEVTIGPGAADVAGVALETAFSFRFRTIAPGLEASLLVPADGSDGIAPATSIAVFFHAPIDPASVSGDALSIAPDVAGTLSLVDTAGNDPEDPADATVLHFVPSGPLPASTTFEVTLGTDVASREAGGLERPVTWSFTTGVSPATLSNQVAFISDRAGVANLWSMNPDGSAPRQLSSELTPVLDYAIAPDGSSFVVGDGRRLVFADASGAGRRVLTGTGLLEFDATYAPDGQTIAFARAGAETGAGLGLWELAIDEASATPLEMRTNAAASPTPSASEAGEGPVLWHRAPRYAPDGRALAFVDLTGSIGIVDLETHELTVVAHEALAPPAWLPDGDALLLTGRLSEGSRALPRFGDAVMPLSPSGAGGVFVIGRSGSSPEESAWEAGAALAAVASDGRIAYIGPDGALRIAEGPGTVGAAVPGLDRARVEAVSFAPGEEAVAVVARPVDRSDGTVSRIERVDLATGDRSILTNEGRRPRWLP